MRYLSKTYLTRLLLCIIFLMPVSLCLAQKTYSDNLDGTYTNPVIPADYPDPDVILVDDTYYFVSTTMFVFPGVTILKSKDLVNWEYCTNAVNSFPFSPCYDMEGCTRYRHGQWASSLRYHEGRFYLMFVTLDEGGFLCTADRAEGPWTVTKLPKSYYDAGMFFDNDGRRYVAHGYNDIYITEVDASFAPIGSDSLVYSGDIRPGLEGAHVYKINDYYYLYCTYGGLDGFQVALRSRDIYGPYEQRIVIRDTTHGPNYGIHQGALLHTPADEWWTVLMVDSGPLGRFPSLQPIRWEDGWPIAGVDGKAIERYTKPKTNDPHPVTILPSSDEFDHPELAPQWGWNHNADDQRWSLTDRPGYLRLETAKVVDSLPAARNTLTQRIFGSYDDQIVTVGTTKIDVSYMKNGDVAGLAIYQDPYSYIAVKKDDNRTNIIMVNNGRVVETVEINTDIIYLRADPYHGSGAAIYYDGAPVEDSGTVSFSYSTDDQQYHTLGEVVQMEFKLTVFTGNKFCLFNYATEELGGYVDFDWFRVNMHEKTR